MNKILESKSIKTLRAKMRKAGCQYFGLAGWYYGKQPIGIYYGMGKWYTVIKVK